MPCLCSDLAPGERHVTEGGEALLTTKKSNAEERAEHYDGLSPTVEEAWAPQPLRDRLCEPTMGSGVRCVEKRLDGRRPG
jgi:hypothetical protein